MTIKNMSAPGYQLPEGTYRELIVKKWMMPFLKKRLATMRKLYEKAATVARG